MTDDAATDLVSLCLFLEVKKMIKLRFLDYFSNVKTEECDQKH